MLYHAIVTLIALSSLFSLCEGYENDSEIACYDELGCFPSGYPWSSTLRPFPPPLSPSLIKLKIYSYTRLAIRSRYDVKLWPKISLQASGFDPRRENTVFMTHGFASDGTAAWIKRMKNAYLKRKDVNVFVVDWGDGARLFNYLQVASNTRIVAAEIARFVSYLLGQYSLKLQKIHLIGHSLGAHVFSYVGKNTTGIGRLTALDPAQPGFEGCASEVRLDKSDAEFVEVIHTSSKPTIPFLGFGFIYPIGHVDYYLNGGLSQPGCPDPFLKNITSIADLGSYTVETISDWVSCAHSRAYEYFTEALENENCTFWAKKAPKLNSFLQIGTIGYIEPVTSSAENCSLDTCTPLSIDVAEYPARGAFSLSTRSESLFCQYDPVAEINMRRQSDISDNQDSSDQCKASENVVYNAIYCSSIGLRVKDLWQSYG